MNPARRIRLPIASAILIGLAVTLFFTLRSDFKRRHEKRDLIELLNIKYGLFNVDEWRNIVSTALSEKIEGFDFDQSDRKAMKANISGFLTKVVSDLESRFYENNALSMAGLVKNGIAGMTGTFDRIKKDIPVFSEQIIDFLGKPENKKAIRSFLIGQIDAYAESNLERVDYTLHDAIIQRLGAESREAAVASLAARGEHHDSSMAGCASTLTLIFILAAFLIASAENLTSHEMLVFNAICLGFLFLGLTLPMIEIDARISEMSVEMLGIRADFKNQVLYYKSKSVLEVVWLMVAQGSFGTRCVGVLILCFSVLFPLAKLALITLIQFRRGPSARGPVRWLLQESGKWSMADVMVVAIFMSYVGFSGILNEQLKQLENIRPKFEVLTTNHSTLQTGFFAFTGFVLLSMLLTRRISFPEGNWDTREASS